jgi:oxygen-independent coproporphyrinogen-3 oxidase
VRWWNAKHPSAYADRISAGVSPAIGREVLDATARETERVLLLTRIREGIDVASLTPGARLAIAGLIADELVDAKAALSGGLMLTRRGRLLADAVVRRLVDA